jgi:hypothetical protein
LAGASSFDYSLWPSCSQAEVEEVDHLPLLQIHQTVSRTGRRRSHERPPPHHGHDRDRDPLYPLAHLVRLVRLWVASESWPSLISSWFARLFLFARLRHLRSILFFAWLEKEDRLLFWCSSIFNGGAWGM